MQKNQNFLAIFIFSKSEVGNDLSFRFFIGFVLVLLVWLALSRET